jgi:acetyl esterase/lipase
MQINVERSIEIRDVELEGHAQAIRLRTNRPPSERGALPVIFFLHGGRFVKGTPEQTDTICSQLAMEVRALVVSVGYSPAPKFPFPTALCDGYRAAQWVLTNARPLSADIKRMAVAGHNAGGNRAVGLVAMVRDQAVFRFSANALLVPLLDPSTARIASLYSDINPDMSAEECAYGYRAYLSVEPHRLHPYAAPIGSRRLKGLPAAFIATAENDLMHVEAGKYAAELIAGGVPTMITRYGDVVHNQLASRHDVLAEVAAFFNLRFGATSQRS